MENDEIVRRLEEYCDEILFSYITIERARELVKEIDAFCEENHVTQEQRDILAYSGAGEVLEMLATAPDE